ncbi:MAG: DUF721 domain-containing protein [Prolixibacteraceae bacterium]|nr:DUF721 domain-containing protein [Prolixibacteraceae bacterium]
MRRKETQKISDVIRQFTREQHLDQKLYETRLVNNWGNVLGPVIADSTKKIFINNRVLVVHIESSVIRHELFMMRSKIVAALNQSVGQKVIDSILFR